MTGEKLPRLVSGTVTRYEPFGFFVDLGETREGLIEVPMIPMDPDTQKRLFLPVGSSIKAALLGYTDPGGEPRLSLLPQDLKAAGSD